MNNIENKTYIFLSEKPSLKIAMKDGSIAEFSPYYRTNDEAKAAELGKIPYIYEVDPHIYGSVAVMPNKPVMRDHLGKAKAAPPQDNDDLTTKEYTDALVATKAETDHRHNKNHIDGLDGIEGMVKSINNILPDSTGNVILPLNLVKTVEATQPDSYGNIQLPEATQEQAGKARIATPEEAMNGVENQAFITPLTMKNYVQNIGSPIINFSGSIKAELVKVTQQIGGFEPLSFFMFRSPFNGEGRIGFFNMYPQNQIVILVSTSESIADIIKSEEGVPIPISTMGVGQPIPTTIQISSTIPFPLVENIYYFLGIIAMNTDAPLEFSSYPYEVRLFPHGVAENL